MKLIELTENKNGTYAGYKFDKDDLNKIEKWCKENKIPTPVSKNEMHTTILYSKKPCPNYKPLGKLSSPIKASIEEQEVWDTQDKKRALVVKLNSPDMVKRHKQLMKEHKASFDYDEYKPHITLSYDVGKDFTLDKISKLKDSVGSIQAVEEYYEPLKDNWQGES